MAERAQWKSRFGFVLAAAGSAVGLGNIWKFPYITGENGGGLFVLIYLVCILLVGLPIMMAEILIGRAAQRQPAVAFETLQGRRTTWTVIGWLGVLTGFIILSYYSVVAGWAMDYTLKSIVNFTRPIHREAELEASRFIASASVAELKELLVEQELQAELRAPANRIRAQASPSVWRDYDRFQTVIAESQDAEMARQRLFADREFRGHVERAQALLQEIETLRSETRAKLNQKYVPFETAHLARAEAARRRQVVFEKMNAAFGATATDGWTSSFWSLLFMVITSVVVAGGIAGGIERACRVLMPTLFCLICLMVAYGATQPGFPQAFRFVFWPDPTKLKPSGVLEALGHAFFTLSLGMGAMITYGSYQQSSRGLLQESGMIVILDTLIALLACLMIFPIIFSYGQEPAAGAGLVFKSMPLAFSEIGAGGMLLAIIFFGLLVFAALTSAISLLEVVASYFIDQHGWERRRAAWFTGGVIFLFSLPTAFSEDARFAMSGWKISYGMSFFDVMDVLTSNWMLPLGGLLTALYVGWVLPERIRASQCEDLPGWAFRGWLLMVRVVAPALVVIVLLQKVGILEIDEYLSW